MATNYLLEFIQNHPNDWEEKLSSDPYNLKISRDGPYVMFKYNQLSSDFSNPIVREARGIIFREDNWKCVRRAFDKFFNYGEPNAAEVDWNTAKVQTKIDGSLISAWFDDKKWHYSTNGTIDAYKALTGDIKLPTFGDVLEEAFRNNGISKEKFEQSVSGLVCYTFELVSPQTRVVIPYEKPDLYFIGCRTMKTERDTKDSIISSFLKTPKEYDFHSAQDVIDAAKELPWNEEGYVVVDSNFNRVKIKSPAWLVAHYARSNNSISKESLIQVILDGEQEEFLVYANDYREELESVEQEMEDFVKDLDDAAREMKKKYAADVLKYPKSIQPYLFSKITNQDAGDWVKENMTSSKWVKYLEARKEQFNVEEK
jgi:T4 RnlA family RNA ligase